MEFAVLGPLEVQGREGTRRLGSRKQRLLLAALLLERRRVVPAERLVDVLWDADPPPSARNSLQTYVARLRGVLADEVEASHPLVTRGSGYALEIAPEQLDAARFERLLADARQRTAAVERLALLDQALELWRGPALADLADCDALRGHALRLDELRLAALEARVDAGLALGRHTEAVADLDLLVAAQPLRERPHEQLVRALAGSGRTGEAVDVVRGFRQRLAEELGLDPSPRLAALEREVLRRDPQVSPQAVPSRAPAPSGGSETPPRRVGRLPRFATALFGRDGDRRQVEAALATDRLVTLTGPGGVGKTRLAVEVATARAAKAASDARLCELAAVDADAVPHVVAAAAEVALPPGQPATIPAVVEALGDRVLLLVLDSCEHLLEAAATLADAVLRGCANTTVLATSRERLGVDGERVHPVAPLAVPAKDSPAATASGVSRTAPAPETGLPAASEPGKAVATAPAVRLFLERARAACPGFQLTEGNAAAVAEICCRLDGLPLAIELAAARVGAVEPVDLAARLEERFSLLEGTRRAGAPRHRTLRGVVDWSYDLLDPAERRVFERAAVFPGGFTLDLAEQVCAAGEVPGERVAACVAGLVDKSMLVAGGEAPPRRYALLETLRVYARERLAERGDDVEAAEAHATAMVSFAEHAAEGLATTAEGEWAARLDDELVNLRAARGWARQAGHVGMGLRLSAALHRYGSWRLRHEVLEWAETVVCEATAGAPCGDHASPAARHSPAFAGACAAAGVAAWMRGDLDAASAYARRGLAAAGTTQPAARARLHEVLGDVAAFRGRLHEAVAAYAEAARLAEEAGDEQTAVFNVLGQTLAYTYGGRQREALDLIAVAERRAAASGNPSARAWAAYARGEALAVEDPERALGLVREAGTLAAAVRNEFVVGVAEVAAAALRSRLGEAVPALEGFAALIERWRQTANWTQQWTTLRNLVELLSDLGADEEAVVLHAAATAPETGAPSFGAEAARLRAAAHTAAQRLGQRAYEAAVEHGRQLDGDDAVRVATRTIRGLLAEREATRPPGAASSV